MFPIILTPSLPILIVGKAKMLEVRTRQLVEAGFEPQIFAPYQQAIEGIEKEQIQNRLPNEQEIANASVIFIVDLNDEETQSLVTLARKHRLLVNVHDQANYCDFNVPSLLRRGDLLVSVSTGGKAPGLAKRLRHYIGSLLPDSWAGHINELAEQRNGWKQQGLSYQQMVEASDKWIDQHGWLPERKEV